jgi:hypothetical protein
MTIKAVVHNTTPVFAAGLPGTDSLLQKTAAPIPIRPGQKRESVTVNVIWALQ